MLYISQNNEQTADSRVPCRRLWQTAQLLQQIWILLRASDDGAIMTPAIEVADFVAALVLDPRHRCTPLCLCDRVREIPQVSEAIERLEYQLRSLARARRPTPVFGGGNGR
jgi:hypothetical protein